MAHLAPDVAFKTGLPLCQALSADRSATKIILLGQLGRLWRSVKVGDARTWSSQEDLQDTIDDVVEQFPTMKIEEILIVFKRIRQGEIQTYGRLDTPTLMSALREYESTHTIPLREASSRQPIVETAMQDTSPAREGAMTISEALKRIGQEMPRRTKTLEEVGRATIADLRVIADATAKQEKTDR